MILYILGVDVKDFGNVSYESLDSSVTVSKLINYNHVIPNLQKVSEELSPQTLVSAVHAQNV